MKSLKKIIALLLCLAMVMALAACGGDSGSSTPESQNSSSEASTEESSSQAEESSEGGEAAPAGEFQLPIVDEPTTLKYFVQLLDTAAIVTTDYNDNQFYQEMENRTGVHLEFEMVSSADYQTNFNLMIASGNLADLMYVGASYYSDGVDAAIDDGYFLDLTDKVDEYMPNYQKVRLSDPNYTLLSTTDSGRLGAVYEFRQVKQGPWLGMWVRGDWLEDLNLEVPETFDEWHDMLKAFKDEKGATAPLTLNFSGSDGEFGMMSAGLGVLNNWQLNAEGKVAYGPYSDAWREYVTIMHDWYVEGLVDPDFMSTDQRQPDMAAVVTGKTGAVPSTYTTVGVYETSAEDPNASFVPAKPPVKNAGDAMHIRLRDSYTSGNTAISADCENWEVALKYLDYLYTEEGALLANYGIEGDTFNFENGKPVFTDKIINNPDGWTLAQTRDSYLCPSAGIANWSDWRRETFGLSEAHLSCYDVWTDNATDDWRLPTVTLTKDEATERATLYADISTCVKENTAKFISGAIEINDDTWNAFIAELEQDGVARAIEITQGAYERYLAR